jgi:hypothetical protein
VPIYADDIHVSLLVDVPGAGPVRLTDQEIETMITTEQPGQTCMRLEATLPSGYTSAGSIDSILPLNGHLRLVCDYGQGPFTLMDFAIRDREYIDDGRPRTRITAYDPMWELNKDECIYFMAAPQNPAVSIIRRVLEDRGVPIGALPGPRTMVHGMRFVGQTRMALIQQMLILGFQNSVSGADQEPYFAQWKDGTFNLVQGGKNGTVWWVRDEDTVAYYSHRTTMEDFVSEVFVMGPDAMQAPSAAAYDFTGAFTALVPNERVDYESLAAMDPDGASQNQQQLVAQEALSLFNLAGFKNAQKYAHIRKIVQADATGGNPLIYVQQALDVLFIQGVPWDTRTLQCSLLPWLRKGDALLVQAGTMNNTVGIVTGVEHDFLSWVSHVTFDSSGLLGRRVRRQAYLGPIPGGDQDQLPGVFTGDPFQPIRFTCDLGNPPTSVTFRYTPVSGLVERLDDDGTWLPMSASDLTKFGSNGSFQAAYEAVKAQAADPSISDPLLAAPLLIPDISQYVPGSAAKTPSSSPDSVTGWTPDDPQGAVREHTGWDPATPPIIQTLQWTCSAASTAWMLKTMGFTLGEIQIKDAMGPGRIHPTAGGGGLQNHTGQGIVDMLRAPPFNLKAYCTPMTYDQALASAGTKPMIMGSTTWGHWVGVRGRDGDNISLANPGPNFGGPYSPAHAGPGQSLPRSRTDLGTGGLFDVVWVDP